MPTEWPFAESAIRLGGAGRERIGVEDGQRQQATARSILEDLATQPGVVLADEVGMGKTYVALAVVASVVLANRGSGRPVVVMMPPGLTRKWIRDWEQFKTLCCERPQELDWVLDRRAETPAEFFKMRDDPRAKRPHIIWMPTNCFARGLEDPWVKMTLLRLARTRTKLSDTKKGRLFKWATSLARMKSRGLEETQVAWLLSNRPAKWHQYLVRQGFLPEGSDDPVPADLLAIADTLDFGDRRDARSGGDYPGLATLLRDGTIPGKTGAVSSGTEGEARRWINDACQAVYWQWIEKSRWRSPLLVMDEAHHAKNDDTRLASLFRSEETLRLAEGDRALQRPPLLWEKFDRMVFLTATPFQLGHHELIRVLRSFAAAKWSGPHAPLKTRADFLAAMADLEQRLNENRMAGRRLDRLWGRCAVPAVEGGVRDGDWAGAAAAWWTRVRTGDPVEGAGRELAQAIRDCIRTRERAETDSERPWASLHPWVVRHNRPTRIATNDAHGSVPRRLARPGRLIAAGDLLGEDLTARGAGSAGLPIAGEGALPFLLAARAQGELARSSTKGRAFFAEGLCSSFEAFHHTRDERGDTRDVDDEGLDRRAKQGRSERVRSIVPVSWYEEQVGTLIPSKDADPNLRYQHPKIRAVVDRAVSLWLSGEKVLLFCFYRETAKALRDHIRRGIIDATMRLAGQKLGLDAEGQHARVEQCLDRVARRLADVDSPLHRVTSNVLNKMIHGGGFLALRSRKAEILDLLSAYVRSRSFIARYLPLDVPAVREALLEGSTRSQDVRAGADALERALTEQTDASSMNMKTRVLEFLRFARELAQRARARTTAASEDLGDPLSEYLQAVADFTSPRGGIDDDEEVAGATRDGTLRAIQPVRMVYGATKRDVRDRVMLAFNSPMFPEVLISSAVLGEGVDLHRFCRYVIHHDLCWNPSTIEQRTGRLDRIMCKAETSKRSIVVYEPFLGGSADEKMYRVVKDRERWFQVVMGQKFEFDEATSEALASRVPLPDVLAQDLIFDLRRWKPDRGSPAETSCPSRIEARVGQQGMET